MRKKLQTFDFRLLLASIALGLLVIIIIESTAMIFFKKAIKSQEQMAETINESGRQRMLSQQIALLSEKYTQGDIKAKAKLKQVTAQYLAAHKRLSSASSLAHFSAKNAALLHQIYDDKHSNLDALAVAFAAKAQQLVNFPPQSAQALQINKDIFTASQGKLLELTNSAVLLSKMDLVDKKQLAHAIEEYCFYIILLVVVMELLFVFIPTVRKVKSSYDQAVSLVFQDSLTNLGNRYYFIDQLTKAVGRAKRADRQFAIFYIDLDDFKHINEAHGLALGDAMLIALSERLQRASRSSDTVARIGGDQFALLLEDIDTIDTITMMAERYLDNLARPFYSHNKNIHIPLNIGIAVYPYASTKVNELMAHAATALLKAKKSGKNRFAFYTEALYIESMRHAKIDMALQYAIKNEEFELYYQPQINSITQQIIGVEALIRWNNPELNNPSPHEFIPIAEGGDHIFSIGQWVLNQSLIDLAHLQSYCGLPELKLSINLSGKEFYNERFLTEKLFVLAKFPQLKNHIVFEITETALVEDIKHAAMLCNALVAQGAKVALDDFGTGYSSLKYLKTLPISIIKIDRSFVKEINVVQSDMEIIKVIGQLSKAMNFEMVGEGVETTEQLHFMQQQGCDVIQGYYFAKPMPLSALKSFINTYTSSRLSEVVNQVVVK